ncbi:unnamed protein product [Ambrosiozyma monospora]|uniref:Unnamed protein product n=1 Tax=Ambrosiozyma monospora TaxID=43982 RepID=A0ACB5TPZ0_AMBMO|nr:unnamed protein product [Ambrosiozyma monospora]
MYYDALKLIDYYPNVIQYMKVDVSKTGNYDLNNVITSLSDAFRNQMVFGVSGGSVRCRQLGTFLINSLNSMERMNDIAKRIGEEMIDIFHEYLGFEVDMEFWSRHATLWKANGLTLNKMVERYITKKIKNKAGGFVGKMAEHSKKYVVNASSTTNNDINKQDRFDRLLGRTECTEVKLIDPIHDFIRNELDHRRNEFTSLQELLIYCGTFNVNAELYEGDLSEWIFPKGVEHSDYDMVIIGLEEVVELTASKLINIDPSIKLFWEDKIQKEIGDDYLLIKNEQLGGILSLVYVKTNQIDNIKNIESCYKKTGMKGMSANKGGVAISFTYCENKFLFIVSHLAAGLNNVIERHTNYKTIAQGLRFRQNKRMRDFNLIIWMGDFNFRIDLPNEVVKPLIEAGDLKTLFTKDQLNNQMSKGESFPYFNEMEINFKPTYKYDKGTNEFDTSEKQRIPAWTDRIVSWARGLNMEQLNYGAIHDICFSDHKPVYGVFKYQKHHQ